jgi:hypothetical protein
MTVNVYSPLVIFITSGATAEQAPFWKLDFLFRFIYQKTLVTEIDHRTVENKMNLQSLPGLHKQIASFVHLIRCFKGYQVRVPTKFYRTIETRLSLATRLGTLTEKSASNCRLARKIIKICSPDFCC